MKHLLEETLLPLDFLAAPSVLDLLAACFPLELPSHAEAPACDQEPPVSLTSCNGYLSLLWRGDAQQMVSR